MSNIDRQVELIKSALSAARSSLRLAEDLLFQLSPSQGTSFRPERREERGPAIEGRPVVSGSFDGSQVKLSDGTTHEVAPNYISKVPLVYGDILKVDRVTKDGKAYFKQLKRVRRVREEGVLAKKDGKWVVVTSQGSHKVTPYAVEELWGAKEGDEAFVLLPEGEKNAPFAAIESVKGKTPKDTRQDEVVVKTAVEPKKEEVKKVEKVVVKEEKPKIVEKAKAEPKKEEAKKVEKAEVSKEKPKKIVEDDDLR